MKLLKYLSVVLVGLVLFVACQKELSVESGYAGKAATGSLLDSANNCQNITVGGSYYIDSTLADNNYVDVQVNFATGGSYRIFTDTQNGFSFQDSGFLPAGPHRIRLKAVGRPVAAKQTTFNVAFDTTFCSFSVTVIGRTPGTYSLVTSGTSCSSANVQGTYTIGTALNSTNRVTLQVNVTALGSYNVTTNVVGGMTFNGTGNFTTLGPQTITLTGSGTPTTAGTNTIPVTAGTSDCSFPVTVTTGPTGPIFVDNDSDSAWEFTEGGKFFHGPFYDVFDTTLNGAKGIIFDGFSAATGDTTILFAAFSPTGNVIPGTYSSKGSLALFYFTDYATDTAGAEIYYADPTTTTVDTKVIITSYDPVTGIVIGTFTGTVLTATNTTVTVSNGKFRAKVR